MPQTNKTLRLAGREVARKIYKDPRRRDTEAVVLSALSERGVDAPRLSEIDAGNSDRNHLDMEWIDGTALTRSMLDSEDGEALARQIGATVREIHDRTKGVPCPLPRRTSRSVFEAASTLPAALRSVARSFLHARWLGKFDSEEHSCLLHRDVRIDNFLVAGDRLILVDYENAVLGYGPGDLVRLVGDDLVQRSTQDALLEGYRINSEAFWAEYAVLRLAYLIEMAAYLQPRGQAAQWATSLDDVIAEITTLVNV